MIEVIVVPEPEPATGVVHYEARDMYISPESSGLAVKALECAVKRLGEWKEGMAIASRVWEEGTKTVDLTPLGEKIDACELNAKGIAGIAAEGDTTHIREAHLVYEGLMYGFGLVANLESRRGNVLDNTLWAMDFAIDSWPRRRLCAKKRASLLDGYLEQVKYIVRTPGEYIAAYS